MTKEKIKELLLAVYSGWKNIDDVVDEIYDSFQIVTLPPAQEPVEDFAIFRPVEDFAIFRHARCHDPLGKAVTELLYGNADSDSTTK